MVTVNLLPESVAFSRRRRRRLRAWFAVVLTTGCVVALPVGYDFVQSARAASLERNVSPVQQRLAEVRQNLRQETTRYQKLATQIARADALRAKRAWSDLLSAVAQYTPETVWLLSLDTKEAQPESRTVKAPVSKQEGESKDSGPVILDGPSGMRLTGYALDHESLYSFMSELKRAKVFTAIELTSAGKEPVLEGTAVRFVLDCDW